MARTRQIQRPPEIPRTTSSRSGSVRSKSALALLIGSALAAVWAVAMLTPAGRIAYVYMFVYLEFYLGPVTLVSLTLTVMLGLVATDRSVLMIKQRVVLQSSHRALGMVAVGSLVLHILTKVASGRLNPLEVLLPFISGRGIQGFWVGLGSVAAYLMVATLWTGIIRARFVGVGKPWVWRALHSTAYASWPFGLLHGLKAGRSAATWVTLSYIACILLVVIALLIRLAASIGRKRKEAAQTTGSIKAVGKPVQTGSESWTTLAGAAKRIAGSRERVARQPRLGRDVEESFTSSLAPPDPLTDSWVRFGDVRKGDSPGQRPNRFAVPEVPLPRSGTRSVPEDPWDSPRRWSAERSAPEDPWDSPRRWSPEGRPERPAANRPQYQRVEEQAPAALREETREIPRRRPVAEPAPVESRRSRSARYTEEEDEAPVTGSRRGRSPRYADDEPAAPVTESRRSRSTRYADDEDDAPVVQPRRSRSARYAEEEDEAPVVEARRRTPRYADDEDDAPVVQPRRSRSARYAEEEDETPVVEARRRTPRYADDEDDAPVVQPRRSRSARYADDEDDAPVVEPRRGRTARYVEEDDQPLPDDDTPTLVDLASRRARRAAAEGGTSSRSRKKKAAADAVDEAYWRSLRGEAQ
ncbi:hypothetical protein O7627_25235 [Solwaraspora sp. WMMD1047]|uniref:hypothetical protein n=1 Tax=Solwaraspora sp. WMMD1047 TaxID=3016102 RepID=UPI0024180BA1|nr:hypothetical protein [Solwaraspora sp. WMMD1047]MDG4832589.1 hypothetical protein [Solwaraspora sp. WMMD1047]